MEEGSVSSYRRMYTFQTRKQTKEEDTRSRKQELQIEEKGRESLNWWWVMSPCWQLRTESNQARMGQARSLQRDCNRRWSWQIVWYIWKDWEGIYPIKGIFGAEWMINSWKINQIHKQNQR